MSEKNDKKESQRTRKKRIFFRVDDEELKFIQARMNLLHIKNREAYLRKMAIDGQIIACQSPFFDDIERYSRLRSNRGIFTGTCASTVPMKISAQPM